MENCFRIKMRREEIPDVYKKFNEFESEFDVGNNRTLIDGKVLASFYALDYTHPLNVQCILQKNETLKQIVESFKDYIF